MRRRWRRNAAQIAGGVVNVDDAGHGPASIGIGIGYIERLSMFWILKGVNPKRGGLILKRSRRSS